MQCLDHRPVQPPHLLRRQRLGSTIVAYACVEQDLIGIDVADARHDRLVREEVLEVRRASNQQLAEESPRDRDLDRVEPEVVEFGDRRLDVLGRYDDEIAAGPAHHVDQRAPLHEGNRDLGRR